MNGLINEIGLIEKYADDLKGVFTLADLKTIFACKHSNTFYRKLCQLEKTGILTRALRGIYLYKNYELDVLSQKICANSYISLESVLAKNLIIGTVPQNMVRGIKIGKKREYYFGQKRIIHLGISPHLYFGFQITDGIKYANAEKAFLDTLYFYNKGIRFYFDIFSDINVSKLEIKTILAYLKKYKNPNFINFVKSYLNEHPIS